MHRIASLPGNDPQEEITFIEQPNAPVIFLTSATSDITCLSSVLIKSGEIKSGLYQ